MKGAGGGERGPAHKEASALKLRPDPTRWQCAEVTAAASLWKDLGLRKSVF